MTGYRPEQPRDLSGEDSPTKELAKKVAGWILSSDRRKATSGWVAGVYGGRGAGKTSFLLTLLHVLQETDKEGVIALPNVADGHLMDGLLKPSATRADDDLLFLVLDHIEKRYGPPRPNDRNGLSTALTNVRTAEVKRKDKQLFLDYHRDVSPSAEKLPERFVELYGEIATTTQTLKGAFEAIVKHYQAQPKPAQDAQERLFPLFVDDLDLRPDRALELLEIAHLFLNLPGVVVIVTADKDLLLHAIQRALEDRGVHHPGLAAALLAKYVPYSWMLPIPTEEERLDELWRVANSHPPEMDELRQWWPDKAANAFKVYEPIRTRAKELLSPLLPPVFRGLVAVHNRLIAQRDDWNVRADPDYLVEDLRRFADPLGLLPALLPPFVSMVIALDVRYPELGILELLSQEPPMVELLLSRILARRKQKRSNEPDVPNERESGKSYDDSANSRLATGVERIASAREESWLREDDPDFHWPVLERLRPPYLQGRRAGEAWRLLEKLAQGWWEMSERSKAARSAAHFFAISVNGDALEASRGRWELAYSEAEVRALHIDLWEREEGNRPSRDAIRSAKEKALGAVNEKLAGVSGKIELFASAPLTFLLWLGRAIDERRTFTAYNARSQKVFEGPSERLAYPDRGILALCNTDIQAVSNERLDEATLLISFTGSPEGKSVVDGRGEPFNVGTRCVLRRKSRADIEPQDLVPLLLDVLEIVGQLQRDHRIRHIHLALMAPDVVAFFLGRQLKATGLKISLYELYGNEHKYVFDLE